MALVRVIVDLLCATQSDANLVRNAIQTKLDSKSAVTVNVAPIVNQANSTGTLWTIHVDVAFITQIDAVEVRDDVVIKWTSGSLKNRILVGSTVTIHLCAHNDGESPPYQSCRERQFELTRK